MLPFQVRVHMFTQHECITAAFAVQSILVAVTLIACKHFYVYIASSNDTKSMYGHTWQRQLL